MSTESVLSTEDLELGEPLGPKRSRSPFVLRQACARPRTTAFMRARFAVLAALVDAFAITISALAVGVVYHAVYYHVGGEAEPFAALGLFMALLFIVSSVLREEYNLATYLTFAGHAGRVFLVWNAAFMTALVFFFATKQTSDYSRVSLVLFYVVAFFSLAWARAFLVTRVKTNAVVGRISALRVVLFGAEADLRAFTRHYQPWTVGVDIVASAVLRGRDTLAEDLALAAASARVLRPDDIFILLPWSETELIETCVAAFMKVPASIHLGPERVLDRFTKASVSRIGGVSSLHLVRRPLTMIEVIAKRAFDLAVAVPLLIGLLPVFGLTALAIKLDSRGPVFFVQRRYGFNQEPFRIVKFRSMKVAEDSTAVRQAARDDPRVTRVGRLMRRFNIDELPQLLNVIRGEMSLVGPRPHALIHDQQYERSIADYARRHNVKPGITGWAQIHGLRGEITNDASMTTRIEHDLYYIDNWTLGLDLRILAMTLLSAKAFENAF